LVAAAGPVGMVPLGYDGTTFKLATFVGVVVCGGGMLEGVEVFEGGCGAACVTGVDVPDADVFPTACSARVRIPAEEAGCVGRGGTCA
jgi:hypothetical protein